MNDMSNPTSWQKASLIGAELQSAEQTSAGVPTSVGMLSMHDGESQAALR